MSQITQRIEFDAGHRVYGHEGKCAHIHGHRYAAEITVSASNLDNQGRVVDFAVIKEKVGGWINEYWDHNLLLHPKDPLLFLLESVNFSPLVVLNGQAVRQTLPEMPMDVWEVQTSFQTLTTKDIFGGKEPFVMPEGMNPTAENMAFVLWEKCLEFFSFPLNVDRVRIYETPNCWADYPEVVY